MLLPRPSVPRRRKERMNVASATRPASSSNLPHDVLVTRYSIQSRPAEDERGQSHENGIDASYIRNHEMASDAEFRPTKRGEQRRTSSMIEEDNSDEQAGNGFDYPRRDSVLSSEVLDTKEARYERIEDRGRIQVTSRGTHTATGASAFDHGFIEAPNSISDTYDTNRYYSAADASSNNVLRPTSNASITSSNDTRKSLSSCLECRADTATFVTCTPASNTECLAQQHDLPDDDGGFDFCAMCQGFTNAHAASCLWTTLNQRPRPQRPAWCGGMNIPPCYPRRQVPSYCH